MTTTPRAARPDPRPDSRRARQLAHLEARFAEQARALADIGFVMKGSVLQRTMRCGSPGCQCHADPPRLHGPYWQWTAKVRAKTVSRRLTAEEARRYQRWIEQGRRFDAIVRQCYALSAQADALLRAEATSDTAEVRPRRRPRGTGRCDHTGKR
jgi:hypothetical protein